MYSLTVIKTLKSASRCQR